jgi:hypothetical protein
MVYQFREGVRMPVGITAQKVGESLESVKATLGALNTENIVTVATDKDNILHPLFEWDDSQAAHKYRLNQASQVVRAVCIKVVEELPPIRAYFNVSPVITGEIGQNLKREYQPVHLALSNPETKDQIFSQAKKDLDTYHNKYATLVNVAELYMDKLIEQGGKALPVLKFYATFPAIGKYANNYVEIKAFHPKGAVESMNQLYGKGVWQQIYTEEEFQELLFTLSETKRILTKLREINTLVA